MSEIRKALALIKRVDTVEDAPARRMALELGALACDRGEMAARRAEKIEMVDAGPDRGLGEGLGRLAGGSVALTGGNSCRRAESGPRADVGDATRLIALPSQGTGESTVVFYFPISLSLCACVFSFSLLLG